jgi:hypothetical protein
MTVPSIAAVQGLNEKPEEARLIRQSIEQLAPKEEVAAEAPALDPASMNDLDLAAQRAEASKSVYYHQDRPRGQLAEYRTIRGGIGEEVATANIDAGIQADAYSVGETNFPNYDVFGTQEVSQVKVLSLKNGEPRYGRYHSVFAKLVDSESALNQKAAERLLEIQQNESQWEQLSQHLPPNVRDAHDQLAMQQALADQATLRIPQDQVEAVRADLRDYIGTHPGQYGLDPSASPDDRTLQIDQMVNTKVLSIDERYETIHYQAKAAEIVAARDLAVARQPSATQENALGTKVSEEPTPEDLASQGHLQGQSPEGISAPESQQDYSYGYGY